MPSDMQIDLSKTRLLIAKERLAFAEEILKRATTRRWRIASYYAVFAAMRAVLALQGFDSKKHSGIIAEFPPGIHQIRPAAERTVAPH